LRLEEASLRDPERIDRMARELGLQSPQAGQVMRMDTALPEGSSFGDGEFDASVGWFRRDKKRVLVFKGRGLQPRR